MNRRGEAIVFLVLLSTAIAASVYLYFATGRVEILIPITAAIIVGVVFTIIEVILR